MTIFQTLVLQFLIYTSEMIRILYCTAPGSSVSSHIIPNKVKEVQIQAEGYIKAIQ
jgi:hypothetical protein